MNNYTIRCELIALKALRRGKASLALELWRAAQNGVTERQPLNFN